MRRALTAIVLFFACVAPARALASSVVLLPVVGGDAAVGDAARREAMRTARGVLAGEGWVVFEAATVAERLPGGLARCSPGDGCAFELRALLGMDVAVGLSLFGTAAAVERVEIVSTGSRGVAHRATWIVDPRAGLAFALADALRSALVHWESGRSSTAVAPRPIPTGPERPPALEPSGANLFLGGLLVLGSAPMLGYGINTAVRDGRCVARDDAGRCTERIRFREGAGIFTGLGAVLLVAGVVVTITQPIRLLVESAPDSASIHVEGRF